VEEFWKFDTGKIAPSVRFGRPAAQISSKDMLYHMARLCEIRDEPAPKLNRPAFASRFYREKSAGHMSISRQQ
jgi:hypothetical protein